MTKTFYDGILYVISIDPETCKPKIDKRVLAAEYDDPVTLAAIALDCPDVELVIYESALRGYVYRYGNHEKGEWEEVGQTCGYA